jgi:hypothetical protein
MKKILSLVLALILVASSSFAVFADQVAGDAVVESELTRNADSNMTVAVGQPWSTEVGVFIIDQGQEVKFDVIGTISSNATLDKSTWSVSSYTIVDKVKVSGTAPSAPGVYHYTVTFTATNNIIPLARKADTVTITVTVPAPPVPVDTIAPTFGYTLSPATPNGANGWYNTDVTVSFNAEDNAGGSGIDEATKPADYTLTTDGIHSAKEVTVKDKAGNVATVTVPEIKIDRTIPTIIGAVDRLPNANGWYNADVIVSFVANDDTSGVAEYTLPVTLLEGKEQSVIGNVTDNAGNKGLDVVTGINIDKTKPSINLTSTRVFTLNESVAWTATDLLSGLATDASGTIDTSSVGAFNQTIMATDLAGNTEEIIVNYKVAYAVVNQTVPAAAGKAIKAGSNVPITWQFADANGNVMDSSNAQVSLNFKHFAGQVTNDTAVDLGQTAGKSGLSYDALTQTWHFNWKTEKTTSLGTYVISIKDLQASTSQSVTIVVGK